MASPKPSRIAAALQYLQQMRDRAAEFGGGVVDTLADRARDVGGLAYEALTSDPNIGRMTTAEFADAAAARAPTPRLDAMGRGTVELGRAVLTQPVETGKALVRGEVERFRGATESPRAMGQYAGEFVNPLRLAAALRRGPTMQMGDVIDIRTKAKTSGDDEPYVAPTAAQLRAQREIEGVNDLLRYPDQKAIDDYINMEGIVAKMPLNHPARPELESLRDQMQQRLTNLSEPAAHTLFDKGPEYKTSAEFRKFLGMTPEERVASKKKIDPTIAESRLTHVKNQALGKEFPKIDETTGDFFYPENQSIVISTPNYVGNYGKNFVIERKVGDGKIRLTAEIENVPFADEPSRMTMVLEASSNVPRGTGAATQMYLEALAIAQAQGAKFVSDTTRSDAAENIYRRLIKKGVPFKEGVGMDKGSWVLSADDLQRLDLSKLMDN